MKDTLKGQVPLALIVLKDDSTLPHAQIAQQLVQMVRAKIGPVASFKDVVVVERLPKTRSGKILRNVMRAIADGGGDNSYKVPPTIEDASVLSEIAELIRTYKATSH